MKKDKKKSVLVIGGSGFLGSHTADLLSANGYDVTIYDLYESEYYNNSQKMVIGDVLDSEMVQSAMNGKDIIYNFSDLLNLKKV